MLEHRPKILILIEWFAPGYKAGGPIQSCVNMAVLLSKQYNVFVLSTDTDHGEQEPYPNIPTNQWVQQSEWGIQVYYCRKTDLNFKQIRQQIDFVQPDFLYLNLLFSPHFVLYPLWLTFRKIIKATVVLCPRGALYDSALSEKKWKKTPALLVYRLLNLHRVIRFHATNQREATAIQLHFPGSSMVVANNLPNTDQRPLRFIKKEVGSLSCIFIARIVPIKNLLFLLEQINQSKATIHLSIVGPMEDAEYWELCQSKMASMKAIHTVNYLGAKAHNELMPILAEHHLFALPTTGENFGHAIFESFLAGRPVLISDQTPWQNLPNQQAGWDLPLDLPHRFVAALDELATMDQGQYDEWAKGSWQFAHQFIQDPNLSKPYFELFA